MCGSTDSPLGPNQQLFDIFETNAKSRTWGGRRLYHNIQVGHTDDTITMSQMPPAPGPRTTTVSRTMHAGLRESRRLLGSNY